MDLLVPSRVGMHLEGQPKTFVTMVTFDLQSDSPDVWKTSWIEACSAARSAGGQPAAAAALSAHLEKLLQESEEKVPAPGGQPVPNPDQPPQMISQQYWNVRD
eukprot:1424089-Lingulodinium_polyedra.AAC.1